MGTAPRITWVNHASFIAEVGDVRLICDPWLEGTAFKDGWALVAPTKLEYSGFAGITHLWISHQHPDHFAPGTLRKIPAQDRARIRTLYKPEPDKLVSSWLRTNGFANVTVLEPDRWIAIAPDVSIMTGMLSDDAWLAIRSPWGTLLNVNDCVLKRAEDVERIARLVGPVDVLFTQFSYANWVGNPEDAAMRRRDAAEKLERIRMQDRILRPAVIVPFASYIYFCNEENFFLNDGMNAVSAVARFIEQDLMKQAVVLYPGEQWTPGEPHDWRPASDAYAADVHRALSAGPTHAPHPLDAREFERQVGGFVERLLAKNPRVGLVCRERTTFYATDLGQGYALSPSGFERATASAETADLATAAENVLYAIRTPWGGNTLHVSGRFVSRRPGAHLRFFSVLRQLHHYNRTRIDQRWLAAQAERLARGVLRRVAPRLASRA